jgi:antitoxin HigA-1
MSNNFFKTGLAPIHPGDYLSEMLEELNISQASFARTIDVSPMRISHIVKGKRPVTAELALLFAKAFEQTPQYWLNLQTNYDLKTTEKSIASRLFSIHSLAHAY